MTNLGVAAWLLKVLVVESVVAVADTELGHVFRAVRAALDLDPGDVLHIAQVDDQVLVKVRLLGSPRGAGWLLIGFNFTPFEGRSISGESSRFVGGRDRNIITK